MPRIIATDSCDCQQLICGYEQDSLQPMVANSKQDFSARLEQACDGATPYIPKGRGRRAELQRRVKEAGLCVSGESVRKWLSAESIPSMDNVRYIAIALRVNTDWLLTGRSEKQTNHLTTELFVNEPASVVYRKHNETISQVISIMKRISETEQAKILGFAAAIEQNYSLEKQKSMMRTGS